MNSKKVLAGAVAGIAVGVLLGMLFAPKKGSVTREKIHKLGGELGNLAKEKFNEFLDGIIENLEKTNDEVSELAQLGDTKVEDEFDDVSMKY